jgi:hypothetical protein
MTFVNDVALTHSGSAYFTDAMNPELYRVFPNCEGGCEFGRFLGFEGTVLEYGKGLNLNDIAASEDGRYLVSICKVQYWQAIPHRCPEQGGLAY